MTAGRLAVPAAQVTLLDQEGDPIGTRMGSSTVILGREDA